MKNVLFALMAVLSLTACKVENTRTDRDTQGMERQADRMENQADRMRDQAQDVRNR